jgi:hypothetical protein
MLKKIIGLITILLLPVILVNAQSQGPSPRPTIRSNPAQIQASKEHQKPEADKRGTEEAPLVIKAITPQKTQAEKDQERNDREEKAASDHLLVRYAWYLAIITGVLAIVAVYQGIQMRRSVKSQIHAERAYIFVTVKPHPESKQGQPIEGIKEGVNQAKITVTNHGKTPAILTKVNYSLVIINNEQIDKELTKMQNSSYASKVVPETMVIASNRFQPITVDCEISTKDKLVSYSNILFYTCFGRIAYKDVFNKTHITIFCWKHNGTFFEPDPNLKRHKRT